MTAFLSNEAANLLKKPDLALRTRVWRNRFSIESGACIKKAGPRHRNAFSIEAGARHRQVFEDVKKPGIALDKSGLAQRKVFRYNEAGKSVRIISPLTIHGRLPRIGLSLPRYF